MQKLWITIFILFFSCENRSHIQSASDNVHYKNVKKQIYSDLFKSQKKNTEPLPSFISTSIENNRTKNTKSKGFLSYFKGIFGNNIEKESRYAVCEELLDINKVVVVEQNEKLISLSIENDNLINKIGELEKNLNTINQGDNKKILNLESEIIRLNRLIKILSSEIN